MIAIGSRPGHGKTAFMVELAKSVAVGEPFLGRKTEKAVVAYFACEDPGDVATGSMRWAPPTCSCPSFRKDPIDQNRLCTGNPSRHDCAASREG